MNDTPQQSSAARWPTSRLAAAVLQWAGLVIAVVAHPRGAALVGGAALVLLGRGVRRHRSLTRERLAAGARFGAAGGGLVLVVGIATVMVAGPPTSAPRPSPTDVLADALRRMLGGATAWSDSAPVAHAISALLPLATALVALAALAIAVGPQPDVPEPDADERRRVARACAGAGSDLMAPFTGRHDKRYVWSADSRAVVGYRVAFGVCVAGPGPAGAADAHADALAAWVRRCDERGWRPAMIGATTHVRELTRQLGMHGLCIGDEVVVPVHPFRLDTPPMRNVRQAVQRTRNSGVTVTMHHEGSLDGALRRQLGEVVHDWQRGHGERGFSMTLDHLLDGTHSDALLVVAHHDGQPVGFQRYLRGGDGTGLSLDVMPRRRAAPNGVNERLIVEAIAWADDAGIDEVSLNFAAFRTLFEAEPTVPGRVMRGVVHLLDRFINVESLYRFNAKFRPQWNARHVLFRSPADVPFVLAAALRLEFGGHAAATGLTPAAATVRAEHS